MSRVDRVSAVVSVPRYDDDFFAWTRYTAALLREGRLGEVDREHLAEEIEDMGKRDRRVVESRLQVLLAHLLKWRVQPDRRSGSWRATIRTQRTRLELVLRDSPSLRARVPTMLDGAYAKAVAVMTDETGLPIEQFPADCPYTADQVLDEGFFPD